MSQFWEILSRDFEGEEEKFGLPHCYVQSVSLLKAVEKLTK